jgi:dTDP-4-dehydrorhamnose reductase
METKLIVTGVNGKLGTELVRNMSKTSYIGFYRTGNGKKLGSNNYQIDLESWDDYSLSDYKNYNVVIHTAARTHIDDCEVDKNEGKQSQAWRDNVVATKMLCNFCQKSKKRLIMLSTECVFDGKKKRYSPEDKVNPKNWYGRTKLEAERFVIKLPSFAILRSVLAYGGENPTKDIVFAMLERLRKEIEFETVYDQVMAFTYIGDVVDAIKILAKSKKNGIYHLSGPDALSPYELALKLCMKYGFNRDLVKPVTLKKYFGLKKAALRLKYSIFDNNKFSKDFKFRPTSIDRGLDLALKSWGLL